MRTHGTTSRAGRGQLRGTATTLDVAGERGRLPAGQEAREDVVFQLLSQLESVESLAQATASLGPAIPKTSASSPDSTSDRILELSASFQRRVSALCRERAEQAAAGAETDGSKDKAAPPARNNKSGAAAAAALRFRAAAFELYTVLESVELNPAGGYEDEDPAFLAPGNRGWKHGVLCEEAAGWADMVRETGGGAPLPSAELPDFQVRCERGMSSELFRCGWVGVFPGRVSSRWGRGWSVGSPFGSRFFCARESKRRDSAVYCVVSGPATPCFLP